MNEAQFKSLTDGLSDVKGISTSNKEKVEEHANRLKSIEDGSKTAGDRLKTVEDLLAKTDKDFIEWRKRGLQMSPEQRTRRGLGNHTLNENFGKAMIDLRNKNSYLPDVFQKAAMTDTYILGVEYANEIIRLVESRGFVRKFGRKIPMGQATKDWPRRTAGISAVHVAAGTAITATNPTLGQVALVVDTVLSLVLVQNSSLEDAVADLGAFIAEELAYAFATCEDNDAFNGDGTATNGGTEGLFDASLYLLDNKPTEVALPAGKTAFEDVTFDDLMKVIDAVVSGALEGARWSMSRSVRTILRQIKDDQKRPIWEQSMQAGVPDLLLGYPVSVSDQCPARTASAAAKRFVAFGNWDYWYIGDRRQISVKADSSRYVEYDQTGYFGSERFAQNISDGGAFAVLKTPAA